MIKLLSRFGGIWKDGNVEAPVEECFCEASRLVVLGKATGGLSVIRCGEMAVNWGEWWWLDRRIPKSLLPEEAFDLIKVLSPGATALRLSSGNGNWEVVESGCEDLVSVEWGGRKFYAPPGPGRLVEVTSENWLEHLHKECAFDFGDEGGLGVLIGMDVDGRFVFLRKGGGVKFSSQVRVKVGVACSAAAEVVDPLAYMEVGADGKSVLAAEGEKK